MKLFRGNCSAVVDCDAIIQQCLEHTVPSQYGPDRLDPNDPYHGDFLEQYNMMERAGYVDNDSIEFQHYYAGKHFDESFALKIAEMIGVTHISSFISTVKPGKCAPWHWDILNKWMPDKEKVDRLQRFVCFIDKPKVGHIFIVEDQSFYLEEQGNIYQFPSFKSWHAGSNVGLETKWIFTMTALKPLE